MSGFIGEQAIKIVESRKDSERQKPKPMFGGFFTTTSSVLLRDRSSRAGGELLVAKILNLLID